MSDFGHCSSTSLLEAKTLRWTIRSLTADLNQEREDSFGRDGLGIQGDFRKDSYGDSGENGKVIWRGSFQEIFTSLLNNIACTWPSNMPCDDAEHYWWLGI